MATGQSGMFYDANRDMYVGSDYYRDQERQYRQHQEEMMRKQHMLMAQQQMGHNPYVISASGTGAPVGTLQFVGDTKDPLAFLQNTDKKLLLTGEMQ